MHFFYNKVEYLTQRLFVKRGIELNIFTREIELSGLLLLTVGSIFLTLQSMPAFSDVSNATWPKNNALSAVNKAPNVQSDIYTNNKSMIFETQLGFLPNASDNTDTVQKNTKKPALKFEHASNIGRVAMNTPPPKMPNLDAPNVDSLSTDNSMDASHEMLENPADIASIEKNVLPENLSEPLTKKSLNENNKLVVNKKLSQKNVSPAQQADNFYRQALTYLRAGRITEAEANLAEAIAGNPNNQEVRMTLAALLLDNQHLDEAANLLSDGLKIAPKQLDFSIALARLRVESTGVAAGLQTLEQALPYANNNAEFHGFLAVLLQRVERHNEAIAHYKIALATSPSNMQWLIGLGISLQATQQFIDAREVFTQVQNNANLSAELADFVALRLKELSHYQG